MRTLSSSLICSHVYCSLVGIPLYVRNVMSLRSGSGGGRLELTVGPKQSAGKILDDVVLDMIMCVIVSTLRCNFEHLQAKTRTKFQSCRITRQILVRSDDKSLAMERRQSGGWTTANAQRHRE